MGGQERDPEHLLREPAQVFILNGDQPRRAQHTDSQRAGTAWGLWAVHNGVACLRSRGRRPLRLTGPALVCLQPGSPERVELPPGVDYAYVAFTVRWLPRRRHAPGWEAWVGYDAQQPDARSWFGCDLPPVVPPPYRDGGMAAVATACREWWLGDLRRLRAGAVLATWLYDWVLGQSDTDSDDEWARLAALARERMAKGFTVADLACAAGCSRSHLFRRMRATIGLGPQDWLAALRHDHARRLLAGGMSTAAVARQCGYRNPKAFRRWLAKRSPQTSASLETTRDRPGRR